jgi:hypothetical protein
MRKEKEQEETIKELKDTIVRMAKCDKSPYQDYDITREHDHEHIRPDRRSSHTITSLTAAQRTKLLMIMKNMAGSTIDAILITLPAQEMVECHLTIEQRINAVYGKLAILSRDKLRAIREALFCMQEHSMSCLLGELLNAEQCDGQ